MFVTRASNDVSGVQKNSPLVPLHPIDTIFVFFLEEENLYIFLVICIYK